MDDSHREAIFSYGTLRDPKIQKKVIGRYILGEADSLAGFKKSRIKLEDKVYPIIIEDQEGVIEGLVFMVTPDELNKIDKYETNAYRRTEVTLQSGRKAWVYQK